jgi:hypothetical protein
MINGIDFIKLKEQNEKYKQLCQWILDQWGIDTKELQDKVLKVIGAEENG